MGRHSVSTPPFLSKLLILTQTAAPDASCWSPCGKFYLILDDTKFALELKKHFKGNAQTFTRQLHFYGFKKVEAKLGSWGFQHEMFERDQPENIKEIKRKTKIDPETQKLASFHEVEALKSQVSYLQDTLQTLRDQIVTVNKAVDQGRTSGKFVLEVKQRNLPKESDVRISNSDVKMETSSLASNVVPDGDRDTIAINGLKHSLTKQDSFTLKPINQKKRARSLLRTDSFAETCAQISERMSDKPESDILMNMDSVDFDSFIEAPLSDLFSDVELSDCEDIDIETLESRSSLSRKVSETPKVAEHAFHNRDAVKLIADATDVKEADVDKILEFLSKLSLNAKSSDIRTSVMEKRDLANFAGCEKLMQFVPLRIQRVGAN